MNDEEINLERHVDKILRGGKEIWKSYKEHLLRLREFFNRCKPPHISVKEGDSYIRFNLLSDDCGLNKAYFIFEIGDLFPQIRWRNLVRLTPMFAPVRLRKRVCFLPAYSYSFDRLFTLIYWGERQPFFDPKKLEMFDIKSLLFTVPHPSKTFLSAANFVWPKSMKNVWHDSKALLELTKQYIFNALYPPELDNGLNVWHEAPFILVGNRQMDIFTVHKTVCCLDLNSVSRLKERDVLKLKAFVLDNRLNIKEAHCLLSEDSFSTFEERSTRAVKKAIVITEAVVTKHVKVYDEATFTKPSLETFIYPLESSSLFGDERPGTLITITSIILRSLYLNSPDPLRLQATKEEVKRKALSIFQKPLFRHYKWDDFVSRLLQIRGGIDYVIQCMGVYHILGNDLLYIHPSIIEILSILYDDINNLVVMEGKDLKRFIIQLLEILEYVSRRQGKSHGVSDLIHLKEIMEEKLGLRIGYDLLRRFLSSWRIAWESIIPTSKLLSSPNYYYSHNHRVEPGMVL